MNSWTPVMIIVLGYAAGLYFQNKRLDDFRDGLYKYLDAKFKAVEDRLEKLERAGTRK